MDWLVVGSLWPLECTACKRCLRQTQWRIPPQVTWASHGTINLIVWFLITGLRRKSNIWMLQKKKSICILKRALFLTYLLVIWYETNTKHMTLKWNVAYNVIKCIVWLVMVILHLATITLSSAASNLVKSPKTDVALRFTTDLWKMCLATAAGLVPQKCLHAQKALVHCYILLGGINQRLWRCWE